MSRLARPLAFAGALCCGLAAWLLAPVHASAGDAGLRVCLVDASDSVVSPRSSWAVWARETLAEQAAGGGELAIVRFGADVTRLFGPAPATELRAGELDLVGGDGAGSDLSAALELARGLAGTRPISELVLLSDGSFTGARPDGALAAAAARGTTLTWRDPPTPNRPDAAVTALRLPPEPEVGAPLACVVEGLGGRPGSELELRLELAESGADPRTEVTRLRVPGAPGDPAARWSARLELGPTRPGLTRLSARVVASDDALPGNDVRTATFVAGEARLVLVSASDEHSAQAWVADHGEAWAAGLELVATDPEQLVALLPHADLLVTLDLAEAELADAGLEAFVDSGGGWLACGGFGLLAGTPGPLTPLVPAAPASERRAVLLLLDGSGSMRGEAFADLGGAVGRLLRSAPADTRFELAFFTNRLDASRSLPADDPAGVARTLLDARAPGGPTDVHAAIAQLEQRSVAEAGALVFVMSDGRDQPTDATSVERARDLRSRLAARGWELVPVAMGADADRAALEAWSAPDAEVLAPADEQALFEALRAQVTGDWSTAGASLHVRALSRPGAGVARELAELFAEREPPPIERVLRARPSHPAAEVVLETADGETVLVVDARRAGTVAGLATLPLGGWAAGWADAPEPLGPLMRSLARGRAAGQGLRAPVATQEDEALVLTGVPRAWPARVWVRAAAQARLPLDLPPAAGGLDPRTVRRGPGAALSGPSLEVYGGPGAEAALLAVLPLAGGADAESLRPSPRVDRGALPASARGGASESAGRGAGLVLLVLGLAALALGAVLGWDRPGGRAAIERGPRPG